MTATTKLALELLANAAANQTLANTTFAQLNQLVQAGVVDKDLAAPPGSPANEALYIVAGSPTGAWTGKAGQLAYWLTSSSAWHFIVPIAGFSVRVLDELDGSGLPKIYAHSGSAWIEQPTGGFTGGTLTSAINEAPITVLASAATVNIGAEPANTISISGTTTITSLGTIASGAVRRLAFQGVLTLTHNGTSLILPTGANIITAAGDVAEFVSLGSGNWRCVGYLRADGTSLAGGGGGISNPMTTAGDIIVGGASGAPGRLAAGTEGYVLAIVSGSPAWQAASASSFAPVVTESTTARTLVIGDAGAYLRHTNASSSTVTIPPQSSVAWGDDTEVHIRRAAAGNLTLTPGSGVTLNAPSGGTLVLTNAMSVTLKRVASDVWDVIGQTVAA